MMLKANKRKYSSGSETPDKEPRLKQDSSDSSDPSDSSELETLYETRLRYLSTLQFLQKRIALLPDNHIALHALRETELHYSSTLPFLQEKILEKI
jgi:hypothetical protein